MLKGAGPLHCDTTNEAKKKRKEDEESPQLCLVEGAEPVSGGLLCAPVPLAACGGDLHGVLLREEGAPCGSSSCCGDGSSVGLSLDQSTAPPSPALTEEARDRGEEPLRRATEQPDTSMVVFGDCPVGLFQGDVTAKAADFIARHRDTPALPSPCLVVDLDVIRFNYRVLAAALPARVFYAVKANPAAEIVSCLAGMGSNFDVASPGEIDTVLAAGVSPDRISYGNTIKKQRDIAYAFKRGVRLFAFDSSAELEKLAAEAPGARVYCRVLVQCDGAEWPLSRKFGCEPEMAEGLLLDAKRAGLEPVGVSFHVGSQQTDPRAWRKALTTAARVFRNTRARGLTSMRLVNLGGGMPARYVRDVPSVTTYSENIMSAVHELFGPEEGGVPELLVEPGRSIAGDAGVIECEVVLISRKSHGAGERRWVYLDVGLFGGLAETMGEAIRYRVRCPPNRSKQVAPAVLAGPTCDSADIMYERTEFNLPVDLQVGDRLQILATGAYTTTYSAVCFNGFPPLACRVVD